MVTKVIFNKTFTGGALRGVTIPDQFVRYPTETQAVRVAAAMRANQGVNSLSNDRGYRISDVRVEAIDCTPCQSMV